MYEHILSLLPPQAADAVRGFGENNICEIRLRAGRPVAVTTAAANVALKAVCSAREIAATVDRMCGGSLHAYEETIKNGYIPLPGGCRAGVCGTLSGAGISDITSLCIRLPRDAKGAGMSLCRRIVQTGCGMLIYSPPGEGKTTLLRDIAAALSAPPYLKRVAVIDSRREIFREEAFSRSFADIYSGYPKAAGTELAVRTMSPQYIISDELGAEEAESVLAAQNCGVPLIATAHASSLEGLMKREAFVKLHRAGVFGTYVGIRRMGAGYGFDITEGQAVAI